MKKFIFFAIMAFALSTSTYAQDDDIYFVPKGKTETHPAEPKRATYTPLNGVYNESDDWSRGRNASDIDVDTYNRRGDTPGDSSAIYMTDDEGDYGTYTTRIVRFHSPRVGIYVSSPYYADVYDYWCDPWYYNSWYDPWYTPWYGWGWYTGYPYHYHGWYGWGWNYPHYHYGWNWGWSYGGYYPHYGYTWGHYAPSNARRGQNGGWVSYANRPATGNNRWSGSSSAGNRYGYRPSRDFGRNYNNTQRPSRDYGNSNTSRPSRYNSNSSSSQPSRNNSNSNTSRPSRNFGNSNSSSSPSRSFSSPSRNSSGGGSPSRSGGRSFGGRR